MKVIPETRREHDNGVMTKANKNNTSLRTCFFKWRFDVNLNHVLKYC
jgi:hypothetical protein